jgi:hypothetical protein
MAELSLGIEHQFLFWPECRECHTAYIYRKIVYSKSPCQARWFWQPDCKSDSCQPNNHPILAGIDTTSLMTTSGITLKINGGCENV